MNTRVYVQKLSKNWIDTIAYFCINGYEISTPDDIHKLIDYITDLHKIGQIDTTQMNESIGRVYSISSLENIDFIITSIEGLVELKVESQVINTIPIVVFLQYENIELTAAFVNEFGNHFIGLRIHNSLWNDGILEIVPSLLSSKESLSEVEGIVKNLNKIGITVKKHLLPLLSRVHAPFFTEALRLYEEGTSDIAIIDEAMRANGFLLGPFEFIEKIGISTINTNIKQLWNVSCFDRRYTSSLYLESVALSGLSSFPISILLVNEDEEVLQAMHDHINNRIICMILNEAADALCQGHCTEMEMDHVFQYGLGYPFGFQEWLEKITVDHVIYTIDQLFDRYHDERYRVSAWLRDRTALVG
jgi:3-hydroxybutyryl-CoA dehydrogenase